MLNDIFNKKIFINDPSLYLHRPGATDSSMIQNNNEDKKDVFRYNEYRNVTSLDPAFARNPQNIWPVNQIFNGLVQLDDSLNVIPEIARSWIISSDGLEYTFQKTGGKITEFHLSSFKGEIYSVHTEELPDAPPPPVA